MTTAELAELVARDLHHAFMTDNTRRHSEVVRRVQRSIEGALLESAEPLTMTAPSRIDSVSTTVTVAR
jgi:hypothetical protein